MARIGTRLSLTPVLFAGAWLVGCVVPPKSSGELDSASGEGTGGFESDGEEEGEDGLGASGECVGDCATPAQSQWSRVVPTTTTRTWACDVQIDELGRVALAWRTEGTAEFPDGRGGIELMAPDGTLLDSITVHGQVFSSIAFASDGTLRARGATGQPDGWAQWAMGLDAALEPAWTVDYAELSGIGQCDWGWSGVAVDDTDHLVTYDYVCGNDGCPQSILRRHQSDGTLVWEKNPGGNPGWRGMPIAVGPGQVVFHGKGRMYDTHAEVELSRFSGAGDEQWMTVVPGELVQMWSTSDGGVHALTQEFFSGDRYLHRLAADGSIAWTSDPLDRYTLVFGSAADGSGFFVYDADGLHRTDPLLDTIWSTPVDHSIGGWVQATAISSDEQVFALASSNTGNADNYWLSVLGMP